MPKIFHDSHKNHLAPPPTYLMYRPLCLQEEEMLAEKVQGFLVLYDKRVKGFKE